MYPVVFVQLRTVDVLEKIDEDAFVPLEFAVNVNVGGIVMLIDVMFDNCPASVFDTVMLNVVWIVSFVL